MLLDLDPFVTVYFVELHKLEIFRNSPFLFIEVGIDIIIPSLTALLANSSGQKGSDLLPLFEAVFSDLLLKNHIFFRCPVSFDLLDGAILRVVSEKEPPVHTLDLSLFLTVNGLLFRSHVIPQALDVLIELLVHKLDVFDLHLAD